MSSTSKFSSDFDSFAGPVPKAPKTIRTITVFSLNYLSCQIHVLISYNYNCLLFSLSLSFTALTCSTCLLLSCTHHHLNLFFKMSLSAITMFSLCSLSLYLLGIYHGVVLPATDLPSHLLNAF